MRRQRRPGEPHVLLHDKTVWYRWTSPKTGNYRVEVCASTFNTFLKVFRGTAVNALEEIKRATTTTRDADLTGPAAG